MPCSTASARVNGRLVSSILAGCALMRPAWRDPPTARCGYPQARGRAGLLKLTYRWRSAARLRARLLKLTYWWRSAAPPHHPDRCSDAPTRGRYWMHDRLARHAVRSGARRSPPAGRPARSRSARCVVGGDAPVSVQSMMHDPDDGRQRHAAADRRADRGRLRHRPRRLPDARTTPTRCRRSRSTARSRSSPTSTSSRSTCSPRSRPAAPRSGSTRATSASSTTRSSRSRRRAKDARRLDPDRRQRRLARPAAAGEVRQGDARGARRVGRLGGEPVRGARLPRLQDLGQAQRPGRHGQGLRAAGRARRLAAAPRRHRGRARRSRARSSRRSRSARC